MIVQLISSSKDTGLSLTRQVASFLSSRGAELTADDALARTLSDESGLRFLRGAPPDLAVVLGGDGTIMRAARRFCADRVPILGVNLGRIGYLAEVETDEIGLMEALFTGAYTVEERMMLEASAERGGRTVVTGQLGLNDAVVARRDAPILAHMDLRSDGLPVSEYNADGLVIATPTGSTAYAMAAGGPILDSSISAFCVVPIAPHTIHAKPIIFSSESRLEVRNLCCGRKDLALTVDGMTPVPLLPGDVVRVRRAEQTTRLIRLDSKRMSHGFWGTLRRKMQRVNNL